MVAPIVYFHLRGVAAFFLDCLTHYGLLLGWATEAAGRASNWLAVARIRKEPTPAAGVVDTDTERRTPRNTGPGQAVVGRNMFIRRPGAMWNLFASQPETIW